MTKRMTLTLVVFVLSMAALIHFAPRTKAAIDCNGVRADCKNAAGDYMHNCLLSGGSMNYCEEQWSWFYTTCVGGVGCDPIITE